MSSIYCDGGTIGVNPSALGGTWAWVMLDGDENIDNEASGVVTPEQVGLPTVTNNLAELLAALQALKAAPDGWDGDLHTDSLVTLYRVSKDKSKWNGVPGSLRDAVAAERKRLGAYRVHLLDGHPTKEQLKAGVGKRGNPCSKWNARCDEECSRLSLAFRAALKPA